MERARIDLSKTTWRKLTLSGIIPILILVVTLALAILYCFWGYRYLKVIMFLYAFFIGAYYSYTYLGGAFPDLGNWLWLICIGVGLLLAFLAFFFIKFAMFITGGIIGLMIFDLLRNSFPEWFSSLDNLPLFLVGLTFFILLGLLTFASRKHFVIIFSSIYGAYSLIHTAGALIGLCFNTAILGSITVGNYRDIFNSINVFNQTNIWVMIIPVAIFAIAGMIAQYRFTSAKARH